MKKLFCLLTVAMLLVTCLAGCAGEKEDPNAFKVGGTGPLTGGAAIYGNAAYRGALIAVEEINALGGIQFNLKYEDDTHDAEKAINAYNTLKDWGMQLSLGSVTSKPAENTSKLNMKDRIFALTPSASSTGTVKDKDNVYQMCFMDPNQGFASAQYIKDKNLATKIAIIYKSDEDYSKGIRDTFVQKAGELGLQIVSETTFSTGNDTDFSVQVKDAKDKGADLVFLPMYYEPASLILTEAKKQNYAPKWFGVDGMDGILTMDGFDAKLAEGVMLLTPFNADSEDAATKNFVAKYKNKYGEVPNQFAADAYDVVMVLAAALEAKGVTDYDLDAAELSAILYDAITDPSFSYDGLTGSGMKWSKDGKCTKAPKIVELN